MNTEVFQVRNTCFIKFLTINNNVSASHFPRACPLSNGMKDDGSLFVFFLYSEPDSL